MATSPGSTSSTEKMRSDTRSSVRSDDRTRGRSRGVRCSRCCSHSAAMSAFLPLDRYQPSGWNRLAVRPPSTVSTCPVTNEAASEARKTTGPCSSSGSAHRRKRRAIADHTIEALVLGQNVAHRRDEIARRDGVAGDPVSAEFAGQRARQADDAVLGRHIGDDPGARDQSEHGGDVDDPAVPAAGQQRAGLRARAGTADVKSTSMTRFQSAGSSSSTPP